LSSDDDDETDDESPLRDHEPSFHSPTPQRHISPSPSPQPQRKEDSATAPPPPPRDSPPRSKEVPS
jgi:hypothetical protein